MCCSGDSLLVQWTRCELENWRHFFPLLHGARIQTSEISRSMFRGRNLVPAQSFFAKPGKSQGNLSLQHVPVTYVSQFEPTKRWLDYSLRLRRNCTSLTKDKDLFEKLHCAYHVDNKLLESVISVLFHTNLRLNYKHRTRILNNK